jgi:hypothetical protein
MNQPRKWPLIAGMMATMFVVAPVVFALDIIYGTHFWANMLGYGWVVVLIGLMAWNVWAWIRYERWEHESRPTPARDRSGEGK